jgi:hypothetical protein
MHPTLHSILSSFPRPMSVASFAWEKASAQTRTPVQKASKLELKLYFLLQVVLTVLDLDYDRSRIRCSNRILFERC